MLPVYSVFRWFCHGSHSLELIIIPVWSVPAFRLWTHIVPGSSRKVLYGSCFGQGAPCQPASAFPTGTLASAGPPAHWTAPQMGFACCMVSSAFNVIKKEDTFRLSAYMSHCEICFSLLDDITLVFCFNTDIKCLTMFGS